MGGFHIREARDADWPSCWRIIQPVFAAGETYPAYGGIDSEEARAYWMVSARKTYVAVDEDGSLLGTYYLRPNQPGRGDHVCNCGYVTADVARGRGIATAMCEHSQREATRLGFTAMQFNLVVATNTAAVRLWRKLGFEIIGTLPGVFRHDRLGPVDAHVMFKQLSGG
ncbi:MAG: GNAT family N-acetyltransferase [Nitratireductor sp.]|nr:GNAT family N-acetyltransferase [Nitratireductor sp.]